MDRQPGLRNCTRHNGRRGRGGAGHAVLIVRTDRGDLILDNKSDIVLPWKQTGYIFIKREGSDGAAWVGLEEQGVSITTAAQ